MIFCCFCLKEDFTTIDKVLLQKFYQHRIHYGNTEHHTRIKVYKLRHVHLCIKETGSK
jgi:hypothetical protein